MCFIRLGLNHPHRGPRTFLIKQCDGAAGGRDHEWRRRGAPPCMGNTAQNFRGRGAYRRGWFGLTIVATRGLFDNRCY